ncbi:MAG TPA: isoaspartyl peptidase/L-asparaginase [Kofleriaceae bacterium]|nr:isoaspartyl peptidase/L-asparaginase [Kofleriaceae bacterium]
MTALVVHGGAGEVAAERHDRLREGVRAAAAAGDAILAAGGSALDAAVAAVRVLEDDPEFNAGLGSALTRDGTVETDASVMDGERQRVGAVAAVPDLGCAIALARAVLDAGEHAILAGPAAWRFAAEVGIAPAPAGSLVTARARQRLADVLAKRARSSGGTVGAVARDRAGRFAAATSTGGIAGKRAGRVGDSPIPGAGTWADVRAAVSATGDGEAILRVALARGVAARIAAGQPAPAATRDALAELARITGGSAGAIALDATGFAAVQLSPTMPVAWVIDGARGDGLGERVDPMDRCGSG